ncbi:MAG: hypothetical protein U0414_03050 [Polyangiaceae bacterium]
MFGPRLLAFIGYFLGADEPATVQEYLSEIFGIPVSLGALSEAEGGSATLSRGGCRGPLRPRTP